MHYESTPSVHREPAKLFPVAIPSRVSPDTGLSRQGCFASLIARASTLNVVDRSSCLKSITSPWQPFKPSLTARTNVTRIPHLQTSVPRFTAHWKPTVGPYLVLLLLLLLSTWCLPGRCGQRPSKESLASQDAFFKRKAFRNPLCRMSTNHNPSERANPSFINIVGRDEQAQLSHANQTSLLFIGGPRVPWLTGSLEPTVANARVQKAGHVSIGLPLTTSAWVADPPVSTSPGLNPEGLVAEFQQQEQRIDAEVISPPSNQPPPAPITPNLTPKPFNAPGNTQLSGNSVIPPQKTTTGQPRVVGQVAPSENHVSSTSTVSQGQESPGPGKTHPGLSMTRCPNPDRVSIQPHSTHQSQLQQPSVQRVAVHSTDFIFPLVLKLQLLRWRANTAILARTGDLSMWQHRLMAQIKKHREANRMHIGPVEAWRYNLLLNACSKNDIFFIAFHQTLYQLSTNQPLAPDLQSLFNSLHDMFKADAQVSPLHAVWFAAFPQDMTNANLPFPLPDSLLFDVIKFLLTFSGKWDSVISSVLSRGYPLMTFELVETLDCKSTVLQDLLFDISCGKLGLQGGPGVNRISSIRRTDVQNETAAKTHPSKAQVAQMRNDIIVKYKAVIMDNFLTPQGFVNATSRSSGSSSLLATSGSNMISPALIPIAAHGSPHWPVPLVGMHNNEGQGIQPWADGGDNGPRGSGQQLSDFQGLLRPQAAPFQTSRSNGIRMMPLPPQILPYTRNEAANGSLPNVQNNVVSAVHNSSNRNTTSHPPAVHNNANVPNSGWHPTPLPHPQFNVAMQARPFISPAAPAAAAATAQSGCDAQPRFSTAPLARVEYPQSPYDWTSVQTGLHLVRLRSPTRVGCPGIRYYQFFHCFAVEPTPLPQQNRVSTFKFVVPDEDFAKRSRLVRTEEPRVHQFGRDTLRYRLRLSHSTRDDQTKGSARWPISPSVWPTEIYIVFNDVPVFPRRRQHFQKDLPIELTDMVQQHTNTVQVSFPKKIDCADMVPPLFLAVEVIATTDHASVLDMVHKAPKISADETRREMKRRIQPQDCDDIIVQDESLSISLRDPFSSILFRTPVKGLYCRHIECFDLETWLQTRRGKPSQSRTEPSLADGWKCPVCDEDARPPNLRIDEFLSEVREALVKTGTDGARRIKAQLDGTWTVEEEVNENDESNAEAAAAQTDESNQSIEVIEID